VIRDYYKQIETKTTKTAKNIRSGTTFHGFDKGPENQSKNKEPWFWSQGTQHHQYKKFDTVLRSCDTTSCFFCFLSLVV